MGAISPFDAAHAQATTSHPASRPTIDHTTSHRMNDYLIPSSSYSITHRRRWRKWVVVLVVIALIGGGILAFSSSSRMTFIKGVRVVTGTDDTADIGTKLVPLTKDPEYTMPENDDSRLDILLLGIRGEDDVENGGLLTDTIMLFSLDTTTGRAALTSIPRDLTVRVTDDDTEKINTAYIHNGTNGTKRLFSRITGVGIDHIVVVDFQAFQQVVDTLGGVSIYLDRPFEETQQWAGEGASESYVFSLPEGENLLTGEQALYYVRSRYSSSDFDRSRRQMQVMVAIKEKVQGLDLMSDPLTALSLAKTLRSHIDTDLDIFDLGTLKQLMDQGDQLTKIRRYQLTTENFLYETKVDGIYELLPRGDSLSYLKAFFTSVLDDEPIMTAPTLTPSPSEAPSTTP